MTGKLRERPSGGSLAADSTGMNLRLSWGEAARACGGTLSRGNPENLVVSISIDSRSVARKPGGPAPGPGAPDQVFWALKGARFDGHDFLSQARDAAGWVIQQGRASPDPKPPHVLEVPDTLKALQALAAFHRKRFDIPVAAITGSNGKTSTKEMLRSICVQRGPVCATSGNLNNHIGLPLSLLELGAEHRFGVFELGASAAGEILTLTSILCPTAAVLTNIGPAHIEFFGSIEGVFKAKTEALDLLPQDAPVAINIDDPWLAGLETRLGPRAVTYGASQRAAVRWIEEQNGGLTLIVQRRRVPVELPMRGRIHYYNAAAAAAGAVGLGLSVQDIACGLKNWRPSAMRFETRRHASAAWIVMDAYNANPASMKAGIETFCDAYPAARRILALGDMKELGPDSPKFHRELGEWIAGLKTDAVFLAGKDMEAAAAAIRGANKNIAVHYGPDWETWLAELKSCLTKDAALYLKASRAMRFEDLAARL